MTDTLFDTLPTGPPSSTMIHAPPGVLNALPTMPSSPAMTIARLYALPLLGTLFTGIPSSYSSSSRTPVLKDKKKIVYIIKPARQPTF